MLNTINQAEFNALAAQGYNRIPLVLETFADLDTPLSLYLKLANQPFSYLLESVQGGERFGRYSIIGLPAKTRIVAHGRKVEVIEADAVVETVEDTNPLDFVKAYQARFKTPPYEGYAHIQTRMSLSLSVADRACHKLHLPLYRLPHDKAYEYSPSPDKHPFPAATCHENRLSI